MINISDTGKQLTDEAFNDPQPGDVFHDMLSFWVVVVYAGKNHVVVMETNPPCTLPDNGRIRHFMTHDAYREAYAYKTPNLGYWVRLSERGIDVEGWYED